jgi:hypothetical protein
MCKRDLILDVQSLFNVSHKPARRAPKCLSEPENDRESRGFQTPFDLTHIGSMDASLKAKLLLGNATIPAKPVDCRAE